MESGNNETRRPHRSLGTVGVLCRAKGLRKKKKRRKKETFSFRLGIKKNCEVENTKKKSFGKETKKTLKKK
jgi:hypothetical protein